MKNERPVLRLHIWFETGQHLYFCLGRALLIRKIDEHGSLRKAADALGMSYRGAWGKIKKSEETLGVKLIRKGYRRRDGCQLTDMGRLLMETFLKWFDAVEKDALKRAEEILPFEVEAYSMRPECTAPQTYLRQPGPMQSVNQLSISR